MGLLIIQSARVRGKCLFLDLPSVSRARDMTMKAVLCLLLAESTSALRLSTRRSFMLSAPAVAAIPFAANAVKETGYAANMNIADASIQSFVNTPVGAAAGIRLGGSYNDPTHNGMKRKVTLAGSKAILDGADEDGKSWRVMGEVRGKYMLFDFTPKGGPKSVIAEYDGVGLKLSSGEFWTKK